MKIMNAIKALIFTCLIVFIFSQASSSFEEVFSTLELDQEEIETLGLARDVSPLPNYGTKFVPKNKNVYLRKIPCGQKISVLKMGTTLKFMDQRLIACGYIWMLLRVNNVEGWVQRRKIKELKAKKITKKIFKKSIKKIKKRTNKASKRLKVKKLTKSASKKRRNKTSKKIIKKGTKKGIKKAPKKGTKKVTKKVSKKLSKKGIKKSKRKQVFKKIK